MTLTAEEREAMRRTREQENAARTTWKVTPGQIFDVLVAVALEDLEDRTVALARVPSDEDRWTIADQSEEIMQQLLARHRQAWA